MAMLFTAAAESPLRASRIRREQGPCGMLRREGRPQMDDLPTPADPVTDPGVS